NVHNGYAGGVVAASARSFLIIDSDGTRRALCGLPLVHPTVICFVASPEESGQAVALSTAVYDFLRGLGPHVQPCAAPCNHDAAGVASCTACAQPEGVQLLVVVASVPSLLPRPPLVIPDIGWWTARKDNRRVLPVFHEGEHPEKSLTRPAAGVQYSVLERFRR